MRVGDLIHQQGDDIPKAIALRELASIQTLVWRLPVTSASKRSKGVSRMEQLTLIWIVGMAIVMALLIAA